MGSRQVCVCTTTPPPPNNRQEAHSQQWIQGLAGLTNSRKEVDIFNMPNKLSREVFSYFEYVDPCTPGSPKLHVPIEPLVGLMRHPFTPKPCLPSHVGPKMIMPENRTYLLVQPLVCWGAHVFLYAHSTLYTLYLTHAQSAMTHKEMYPGRAWLFDLGAKRYNTSLSM